MRADNDRELKYSLFSNSKIKINAFRQCFERFSTSLQIAWIYHRLKNRKYIFHRSSVPSARYTDPFPSREVLLLPFPFSRFIGNCWLWFHPTDSLFHSLFHVCACVSVRALARGLIEAYLRVIDEISSAQTSPPRNLSMKVRISLSSFSFSSSLLISNFAPSALEVHCDRLSFISSRMTVEKSLPSYRPIILYIRRRYARESTLLFMLSCTYRVGRFPRLSCR